MAIFQWRPGDDSATLYSDVDISLPFVARFWGLCKILELTTFSAENIKSAKEATQIILYSALIPAYHELQELQQLTSNQNSPQLRLQQAYIDLYDHLWKAYKDRTQKAVVSMGYNIGFLYRDEIDFISGCHDFKKTYSDISPALILFLEHNRSTWQPGLKNIRNNISQHKKPTMNVERYFDIHVAKGMFGTCWEAIEEIILYFLRPNLHKGIDLIEIPEHRRDTSMPLRFQLTPKLRRDKL